jgi:hypothetical protein
MILQQAWNHKRSLAAKNTLCESLASRRLTSGSMTIEIETEQLLGFDHEAHTHALADAKSLA